MALLLVVQWWTRDLTGKPGSTFPNRAAQNPGILARDDASSNRHPAPSFLFEHDLFGKPVPIFRIMLRGAFPKKEARPMGPGTPYALRRNIFRKRQKTMVCLAIG
ncbi:hypothetical protein J6524_27880 [Bradyrhizobium sp. WSM 1738]|uniref:hypothetical protein n=1 Tax=Bradyrhizobium hereditatis TaxID=2821405 RepID=UPI001CE3749F|nr:hypothetical protein [Bradyrhizobium hereditatis]MCA6118669.1 hypothetical protein [Bradyrhizobium hereditatis]